jgi:regulator of sirC expression with transglutaminase-like and TPR domain
MVATGKQPTGQWWRDRQDDLAEKMDCPEMTDKERRERIKQAATLIKEAFGKLPWQDEQLAAEALQAAVGTNKLRGMAEYLFADDEFTTDEDEYFTTEVLPLPSAASGGDF